MTLRPFSPRLCCFYLKSHELFTICGLAHTINLSHACRDFIDSFKTHEPGSTVKWMSCMKLGKLFSLPAVQGQVKSISGARITEVFGSRT
jgi:hypothetical protein